MGGSSAEVSSGGAAAIPILGPLGPTTGPSACLYNSSRDSLGFGCSHLGNGAPIKWGALLDLASLDKQPVEVAPSFYPEGELQEAIKAEASSLLELISDIWHVVQRGILLNSNRLNLLGSDVVEEAFPCPSPLSFPEGGLYGVFVADLEHMLKVPSPPTAAVFRSHLCQTGVSRPGMTAGLGLGVSLGSS